MKLREHWMLVAIVLLVVGTVSAFWLQNANLEDHEGLDRRACELSLANRTLIADTLTTLADNLQIDSETRDDLTRLGKRATALVGMTRCHS